MDNLVNGVKTIIERQVIENRIHIIGRAFSSCQKGYFWTNENIKDSLEIYKLNGKEKALCVASSGDHAFNLITEGFLKIDTFDTNNIANYIAFGLKKSLILKYDYKEFLKYLYILSDERVSNEDITNILTDLLPFMENEYMDFWKEIINYNYKLQKENSTNLNLIYLLCIGIHPPTYYPKNNNYLNNSENYNKLKENLKRANITFSNIDAIDIPLYYSKEKYDILMLSNILDYFDKVWGRNWEYNKLEKYINSLSKIMNKDALIYLNYILIYGSSEYRRSNLFSGSNVKKDDFINEEVHEIKRNSNNKVIDGIVLKRVK